LFNSKAHAQTSPDNGLTIVSVGKAELEKIDFGVYTAGVSAEIKQVQDIVANDFGFYKRYLNVKVVSSISRANVIIDSHIQSGKTHLVRAIYKKSDGKEVTVESDGQNLREVSHTLADKIYFQHFGKKSIFLSKIYFVSDFGSTKNNPYKELYVMDFDGGNLRRLTNQKGTVISPAVSHNGRFVLYSLIRSSIHNRNIDLFILDIESGEHKLLSNQQGINSGAVFLPGDEKILLTLSHQGNAEIYRMDLRSKETERLTNHPAPDVDPDIDVNSTLITFLSGRPGKAEIYTMNPNGQEMDVKRISYVGDFNATPRFSPDGSIIVFSSWMDSHFDIFRINPNGTGLYRLTKDFGSNEDPSFSPDGEFIAFTSQRVLSRSKAENLVYIMDKEGEILGALTRNVGNCISPRWSK
jgi:TolB protein